MQYLFCVIYAKLSRNICLCAYITRHLCIILYCISCTNTIFVLRCCACIHMQSQLSAHVYYYTIVLYIVLLYIYLYTCMHL